MKSARDPIVGPPDRPGSRVHSPAPVLTRPLNPHLLHTITENTAIVPECLTPIIFNFNTAKLDRSNL